jgi:hypothetical protein
VPHGLPSSTLYEDLPMNFRALPLFAKAALASAVLATPLAFAGHLNVLLNAQLDGRDEVSAPGSMAIAGDPDGRGEAYVFGIDGRTDVICYNLTVRRIAGLELAPLAGKRMAHIHRGVRGENGPVVANLAWPQGGQSADCLDGVSQRGRFAADAEPAALVAELLAYPERFYINVHNDEFPAGALRGQLRVAHD